MLKTPEKIQDLQRKLYQKAKQEKEYRFYLLYEKVYRLDILRHAYCLVKANKGAPGIDGTTFEAIEKEEGGVEKYLKGIACELRNKVYKPMPVRRVYIPKSDGNKRPLGIPTIKDRTVQMAVKLIIEPVFEADFQENSYGFRPGKSAHKAMDDMSLQLRTGKLQVIDADISKYFDSIPHDKLLEQVVKRIVDKHILKLIKMWLTAPVVEEGEDGKKRYKGNDKGTPQGGVISPLLANIYLNEEKTKIVDARKESFNFLGFTIIAKKNPKTGKTFPLIRPSKKAIKHIKGEIKRLTCRKTLAIPKETIIKNLNEVVRGWTGYFYYGNCSRDLTTLKGFLDERVRTYLRRKHCKKSRGYRAYPYKYLYGMLGLYKIPTTAPWTQTAKAGGRRCLESRIREN